MTQSQIWGQLKGGCLFSADHWFKFIFKKRPLSFFNLIRFPPFLLKFILEPQCIHPSTILIKEKARYSCQESTHSKTNAIVLLITALTRSRQSYTPGRGASPGVGWLSVVSVTRVAFFTVPASGSLLVYTFAPPQLLKTLSLLKTACTHKDWLLWTMDEGIDVPLSSAPCALQQCLLDERCGRPEIMWRTHMCVVSFPKKQLFYLLSFKKTQYEKHTTAGREITCQDSNLSEMIQVFASLRNKMSAMVRKTSFWEKQMCFKADSAFHSKHWSGTVNAPLCHTSWS